MTISNKRRRIEFWGGHDPAGAAGIVPQVEVAGYFDLSATSLPTCLTAQSRSEYTGTFPTAGRVFKEMLASVKDEPSARCFGLLPTKELIDIAAQVINKSKGHVQVVIDPLIAPSAGAPESFYGDGWKEVLQHQIASLYPLAHVITPNAQEFAILQELSQGAGGLQVKNLVMTDGENGRVLLYENFRSRDKNRKPDSQWHFPARPGQFRGTGCRFNAALGCALVLGRGLEEAIDTAIEYCSLSIAHAQNNLQKTREKYQMLCAARPAVLH